MLVDELQIRLKKLQERTVSKQFIKIKFADFTQITRECVVEHLQLEIFLALLAQAETLLIQPVRLLGVGVRFSDKKVSAYEQGSLF